MLRNKKAIADIFTIMSRMGYYIFAILIASALFLFFGVMLKFGTLDYYKSDYGTSTITMDETFFNEYSYEDEFTSMKYARTLDINRLKNTPTKKFDKIFGIRHKNSPKGFKAEIYKNEGKIFEINTSNYPGRDSFSKELPIMLYENEKYTPAKIKMRYWQP